MGLLAIAVMPAAREHSTRFVAFYALAAIGFGLVWSAPGRLRLRWVVVVAVLVRLAMLPVVPSLSDDIYRYVWDGRVQLAGFNPYDHAPDSPVLDGVAYADRGKVNHPAVRTIYPPLAEEICYGVAAVHEGMGGVKVLFGLCDLLTAFVLWKTIAAARRVEVLTLYLLCPLVVVETWHSAHLEVVAALLVLVAAALIERRRDLPAGLALGAAAAVKLWPAALLLPAILGKRARPAAFLPGFALAFLLPYAPYLLTGDVLGSMRDTGARPEGSAFGFAIVQAVVGYPAARIVVATIFVAGVVLISRRLSGREKTTAAFCWTATLLPLLMPIVHPWYWMTAVTLGIAAGLALPVALGVVAPVSYLGMTPGWHDSIWPRLIVYSPLVVALGLWARRMRRRRPTACDASAVAGCERLRPSQWRHERQSGPDGGHAAD